MSYYKKKTVCLSVGQNRNIFILCIVIDALKWVKGIFGNFTCICISVCKVVLKYKLKRFTIFLMSIKIGNKKLRKFSHYAIPSSIDW